MINFYLQLINFFKRKSLKKCPYCKKSDKVEISYRDWCDRCKKII